MDSITSGYLIAIFHKLNKIQDQQDKILEWFSSDTTELKQLKQQTKTTSDGSGINMHDQSNSSKFTKTEEEELNEEVPSWLNECVNLALNDHLPTGQKQSWEDLEVLPEWLEQLEPQQLDDLAPPGLGRQPQEGISKLTLKRTYGLHSNY